MRTPLEAEQHRRKADELLRRAAECTNMKERGRLIDEAAAWHLKAVRSATGETGEAESAGGVLDLDPDEGDGDWSGA